MVFKYFQESVEELRKVTWPTRKQAIRLTVISLVFMLLTAAVIGFFDFLFNCGYSSLISEADFFTAFTQCIIP